MKLKPTARVTRSISMRRDVRHVERKLHELARPGEDDVLDIGMVRYDVRRWVDAIPPERLDESVCEHIDKLVDAYVAEFLRRMLDRRHEELSELGRLKIKIMPYLSQANALMDDQKDRIGYFDMAVTHALDRLSNAETPLTDPRYRTKPTEGPQ